MLLDSPLPLLIASESEVSVVSACYALNKGGLRQESLWMTARESCGFRATNYVRYEHRELERANNG